MCQDNLSEMLLETKGKKLITKKKICIQVRYFFIKDRVITGNVELKHFPTTKILADHFQKPLQGEIYKKFRADLFDVSDDDDMDDMGWSRTKATKVFPWKLHNESDPAFPQEFVGNYKKGTTIPYV